MENLLTKRILNGIINDEFIPYGQPIMDIRTGEMYGVEILIRWETPDNGLIYPENFISTAEDNGIINKLTEIMFKKVSNYLCNNSEILKRKIYFAFNVSGSNFSDVSFYENCASFLSSMQNKNLQVIIEITENKPIPEDEKTNDGIHKLRSMGIELALDDFGTGYSNYTYLQRFDISYLKIDKSFTAQIVDNIKAQALIDHIISIRNIYPLKIIVEGVENKAQESFLQSRNIHHTQGFLYGKPKPLHDIFSQKF